MAKLSQVEILIRMDGEAKFLRGFAKQIEDNIECGLKDGDTTGYNPNEIRQRVKFMKRELKSIEKYLDLLKEARN